MLYLTILYYTILYYTILCYTILYYTILYYTILYYIILPLPLPIHVGHGATPAGAPRAPDRVGSGDAGRCDALRGPCPRHSAARGANYKADVWGARDTLSLALIISLTLALTYEAGVWGARGPLTLILALDYS